MFSQLLNGKKYACVCGLVQGGKLVEKVSGTQKYQTPGAKQALNLLRPFATEIKGGMSATSAYHITT
jgi:hypothetical protein